MYIPIFKEFTQEISAYLGAAERELNELKAMAEPSVSDEQQLRRIETIQSFISARTDYVQAASIYLRMANEVITKLAEVEFAMALACPPELQHLIETTEERPLPPAHLVPVN